jgi:hypothetical protein
MVFTRGSKKEEPVTCRCDELEGRLKELEHTIEQQDKWRRWQANSSNSGGQFGFGVVCHPLGDVQA